MLGFLAGALALVALALPASALAGTYTWNLASDFTATAPGANPDHDQYGAAPWSYVDGSTDAPSTFSALSHFAASSGPGTLSAWSDPTTNALVGINPGATFSSGGDVFPAGQIAVEPGSGSAAVGWTSPFSQDESVSIQGSISADTASTVCNFPDWNVEDQNGNSLASGTNLGTIAIPSVSVPPGGSIFVAVTASPLLSCDATGLSLQITANGTPPAVTLTQPPPGSSSTVAGPTFSGAAASGFGASSQVTLRVYSGSAVSGAPVQTVAVPRSGATWSAFLPSPLAFGTYTAQAEQDDIANPADVGFSAPVTFSVGPPSVTVSPFGSKPLATSTPTIVGTAGTASTDETHVIVLVYAGATAAGTAIRGLAAPVSASGQYSVQAGPALPDGTYTALAVQADLAGSVGYSAPETFSIDTRAPSVTVVRPGKRSRANALQLAFAGAAGNAPFDAGVVTLSLYKGAKAKGKPFGTLTVHVNAGSWSAKWPDMLQPRTYTVRASQTDALGHLGLSAARTFVVIPPPPVIGALTLGAAAASA
jgi:hypothetical protein